MKPANVDAPRPSVHPKQAAVYVPPTPIEQTVPTPQALPHPVRVSVQVSIDETGRVTAAQVVNAEDVEHPAIVASAVNAAYKWRFTPATVSSKPVQSVHTIIFAFRPEFEKPDAGRLP